MREIGEDPEPPPAKVAPVERNYDLRLVSEHAEGDNGVQALDFELRRDGEAWESFRLSDDGSPFLNFLHSAFLCQLAYLRMNATERGLRLERVHGRCRCETADFVVERLLVSFAIELRAGSPGASDADLAYLRERCLACPVSRNLRHVADKDSSVSLGTEPASWFLQRASG